MTAPAAGEAEFRAELERIVGLAAPHVPHDPPERPTLVVLGDLLGLAAIARELRPGGAGANGYRESVVWADVTLAGNPSRY